MSQPIVIDTLQAVFNAIFRPSRFVSVTHVSLERSFWGVVRQLFALNIVFAINLLAYALPLTLAGFGSVPNVESTVVGAFFPSFTPVTQFFLRFVQNGLYLTGAAVVTFVTFHAGVLVTRSSQGVIPSLYTVIYSTSGYLAAIFSFVMYLDTAEQFSRAAELVLWIQLTFVYSIVDAMNSDLVLQTAGRPDPVPPQGLTLRGKLLIAGLAVAGIYYIYSMFLGSRLNHNASRATATLTVMAVLSTPVLFVVGSVLAVTGGV